MSADNILLIYKEGDKIKVADVNFSDMSSHPGWFPETAEQRQSIIDSINKSYKGWIVWKGKSVAKAINFCRKYARDNVVEYGHTNIVGEGDQ